jgi:acetyl-CoA carboxylase alpha subunit
MEKLGIQEQAAEALKLTSADMKQKLVDDIIQNLWVEHTTIEKLLLKQ